MKVFDVFPFFNELDILEIRLHELGPHVDKFIILESGETYGGDSKPYYLHDALRAGRFADFAPRIALIQQPALEPKCLDRTTGRLREAFQRNMIMPALAAIAQPDDIISFGDCDEIPRGTALASYVSEGVQEIRRFKQRSFYYTVNHLVDYGHDFASRARVGRWRDVEACGTMYAFRMFEKNSCAAIENGGWHFSYFGGTPEKIRAKVAAMAPFLAEYKLFGDPQLIADIRAGRDLHHRKCEMPDVFWKAETGDPTLPEYFLRNQEKFKHFTAAFIEQHYGGMVPPAPPRAAL